MIPETVIAVRGTAVRKSSKTVRDCQHPMIVTTIILAVGFCQPGLTNSCRAAEEMLEVTATAPIKIGDEVVTTVPRGTRLWSFSREGNWHKVNVPNQDRRAWIHVGNVRSVQLTPDQLTRYQRANSLWLEGEELAADGKTEQALGLLLKSLPDIRAVAGEKHPTTAALLHGIGFRYAALNQEEKATEFYEQALTAYRETLGRNDIRCATTLYNLGGVYASLSLGAKTVREQVRRNLQALECWRETLAIAEREGDDALAAKALNDIGFNQRNFRDAEVALLRSLAIKKRIYGDVGEDVVTALQNLGDKSRFAGEYLKGVHYYLRALEIEEQLYPDRPSELTWSTLMVGTNYEKFRNFEKAEEYYLRYAALREQEGKTAWKTLGIFYRDSGQYAKAEKALIKAYEVAFDPEILLELSRLDIRQQNRASYGLAERRLLSHLHETEERIGKENFWLGEDLLDLATLCADTDRFDEADAYFSRLLSIEQRLMGDAHPDVADRYRRRGLLQLRKGELEKSLNDLNESRRAIRRHVTQLLPQMEASQQLRFLDEGDRGPFFQTLSVGLKLQDRPEVVQASAEWLLNGKAVAIESLARQSELTAFGNSEESRQLIRMLKGTRAELAEESLRVPEPQKVEAHTEKLRILRERELEIGRELGITLNTRDDVASWIELDAVRSQLPVDTVLIDIIRLQPFDLTDQTWQPERYVAWVIPPSGPKPLRIVDLGDAAEIDELIVRCREVISGAPASIRVDGEVSAAVDAQQVLAPLATRLVTPLLSEVDNANRLILSPDSQLWLVPWSALPIEPNRCLIENLSIRFVATGRDLLKQPRFGPQGPAFMLADPNFDRVAAGEHPAPGQAGGVNEQLMVIPQVSRLPGTAAEARAVRPSIRLFTGSDPHVVIGDAADESVVKGLARPSVAVFSTHGFFLQDQLSMLMVDDKIADLQRGAVDSRITTRREPLHNPLLRCGLLLAGCNLRSSDLTETDDGILTGLEIVGTDLRGTELVVLSACETGVGQVQNGEGVAGLRQAFQLAGAKSVVSTLWQIADDETARLMKEFFSNLASGMSKSEALRQAQLTRISVRRERYGAAHPFFWAAFTITGQDTGSEKSGDLGGD